MHSQQANWNEILLLSILKSALELGAICSLACVRVPVAPKLTPVCCKRKVNRGLYQVGFGYLFSCGVIRQSR